MFPQYRCCVPALSLALALAPGSLLSAQSSAADELLAQARELYTQEGPAPALPLYEQALSLFRQDENRLGEAITLGLIGKRKVLDRDTHGIAANAQRGIE